MKVLLTGATGFLGQYLVRELAPKVDILYVLVRSKSLKFAQKTFKEWKNVVLVTGDIRLPDLVDDQKNLDLLRKELVSIVHAAAFYDLKGGHSESFLQNVMGTQNVLYFASSCESLKNFHYISTIAVCGSFRGVFSEDALECNQAFENNYAKTKYSAEQLVRNWEKTGVQKKIYRPGIIVGESETGEMSKLDGPYYFFKFIKELKEKHSTLLSFLKFFPLPFDPKALIPLIPVDKAAELICEGVLSTEYLEEQSCYHLFAHQSPTAEEFLKDVFKAFGIKAKPIPLPKTKLNPLLMDKLKIPRELLSYMYGQVVFDQKYFNKDIMKKKKYNYSDFKTAFLNYASHEMKYS